MAMAAQYTSCHVGPVPFKDVTKDDDDGQRVISLLAEHADDILPTLPCISAGPDHSQLWQYQGVWLRDHMVTGMISVQQHFKSRPGDVLLASAPKCGTTWLKALSFATMARAAYPPSGAEHPLRRLNPHECVPFMESLFSAGQEAKLEALPSPRLLHTHMHYAMLPRSLADGKVVFVCREPKDMLVSMFHFLRSAGLNLPFPDLVELACQGQNPYGPIWDNVLGYWTASRARPDTVLFLRYEEMLANPVSTVRRLARFLGVPFTAAEEAAGLPADIAEMCSIDTLRGLDANKAGSNGLSFIRFGHQAFFRKGVVGDWVNHMTPDMARRIDAVVEDKLRGSGLTFTSVPTLT